MQRTVTPTKACSRPTTFHIQDPTGSAAGLALSTPAEPTSFLKHTFCRAANAVAKALEFESQTEPCISVVKANNNFYDQEKTFYASQPAARNSGMLELFHGM